MGRRTLAKVQLSMGGYAYTCITVATPPTSSQATSKSLPLTLLSNPESFPGKYRRFESPIESYIRIFRCIFHSQPRGEDQGLQSNRFVKLPSSPRLIKTYALGGAQKR